MPRPKVFDEEKVVQAAMELFWKKGYEGTSIQDLVEHTGLSRSSLYDSLGDKRQLYINSLRIYTRMVEDDMFRLANDDQGPALELLVKLLCAATLDRKGCYLANSCVEKAPIDDDVVRIYKENARTLHSLITRLLERAATEGALREGVQTESAALVIFSAMQGMQLRRRVGLEQELAQELVNTLIGLLRK